MKKRLEQIITLMQKTNLDALALNPGPSLTYLTGLSFHLMERPTALIITPDHKPLLIIPEFEASKIQKSRLELDYISFGDNPSVWSAAFERASQLLNLNHQTIGVEPTRMRFLELSYLQSAAPNAKFVAADSVINDLRIIKDALELAAMQYAVEIAQNALQESLKRIKHGVTERDLASELTLQMMRGGCDAELPFAPIVASGPNSANPHAIPTERRLETGDLLVIDWGASYNGYFSDLTRTFAIQKVDPQLAKIAQIVEQANIAGREAARPGIPAAAVDQAARAVIATAGYGEQFNHRTGHGLGMEAHEQPYIHDQNTLQLTPGMVFTIEPGIYLSNIGGVRIEDDVVITASGSNTLSSLPRQLIYLDI